jgi:glyoxylase-like metal-dependent hydrolase (beta-lactamase superfamily II)
MFIKAFWGLILATGCFYGCTGTTKPQVASADWCHRKPRPGLENLTEVKTKRPWFKVYRTGNSVYAILEPYNYQEVISYLILGKQKALLFDTGMGLDSISPVVRELTSLPIIVLNSHTHYDHIGGNYEFDNILAMNTDFTRNNAKNGYSHPAVRQEVAPDAFCLRCLPKIDTTNYHIKPFKISKFISDRYTIELGGRNIRVIATPGHTVDEIALFDVENNYLWTGDSFYEGPIFLFDEGTDLTAYQKSIGILASIAPGLKAVFPSHNLPLADPKLLITADKAFAEVRNGKKEGVPDENNTLLFKFGTFSFLIKKNLLN